MIANRSVPKASVIPELAYPDVAEAAAWLCNAFGFRERLRIGDHRTQLTFGDGALIVTRLGAGGHRWTFSQSIADVDPADWGGTAIDIA